MTSGPGGRSERPSFLVSGLELIFGAGKDPKKWDVAIWGVAYSARKPAAPDRVAAAPLLLRAQPLPMSDDHALPFVSGIHVESAQDVPDGFPAAPANRPLNSILKSRWCLMPLAEIRI
jgi:hypothetical protein